MGKFVSKFRKDRDYSDEYGAKKSNNHPNERKKEHSELRKMKMQRRQDDSFSDEDYYVIPRYK